MMISTDNVLDEGCLTTSSSEKMDESNAFGSTEDLFRFNKTGYLIHRQIDLRDITGDHRFDRTEPCQEHLHLALRLCFGLIENDK